MESKIILDKKNQLLVSVIVPIHNRFSQADEAVASVLAQTYRPIELTIVDDCSDEQYQPKIQIDQDVIINVIRHKTNLGPGASRESGRLAATGDFIAYMDSDDLWHPEKTTKQIAVLQVNPETGMCYCQSAEFSKLPLSGDEQVRKRSDQKYSSFLPTILYGRPWDTSACLWTRAATDSVGPWFNGWTWEDYEYDCRAGCRDIQIAYIPEVLCYYRVNYGDSQLSQSHHSEMLVRKTESIIQMDINLRDSNKISIKEIRDQFVKILFFQAMDLFYADEKPLGVSMLKGIIKVSNGYQKFIGLIIYLINPFLRSIQLGFIAYKLRKIFRISGFSENLTEIP